MSYTIWAVQDLLAITALSAVVGFIALVLA